MAHQAALFDHLTALEAGLAKRDWQQARPRVRVKLLPQTDETYVLVQSQDRIAKERAMRRRPIRHQLAGRIEAHLFVSFPACCLQVTLKARLSRTASVRAPRAVPEKEGSPTPARPAQARAARARPAKIQATQPVPPPSAK